MLYKGRIWKFGDDISSDLIMPGYIVFGRPCFEEKSLSYVMDAIRPGWYKQVKSGDIIVAGKNFGCGSCRSAPVPLKKLGISLIIAESMARQFFRNAIHIGLPVMIAPGISRFVKEHHIIEANLIDGQVKNHNTGEVLQGDALEIGAPPYQILQYGGIEALIIQEVNSFG